MASVYFRGDAPRVAKSYLISVASPNAGEEFAIQLKDEAGATVREVTYIASGSPTEDEVSEGITAAINDAIYEEFAEFTAVDSGSGSGEVVVTQDESTAAGLTLTLGITADGAATVSATVRVESSSPTDWELASNWTGGLDPSSGSPPNDVYVANLESDIDCNLEAFSSCGLLFLQNVKNIGGAEYRGAYREYRAKYLKTVFVTGIIDSPTTTMLRLDGGVQNSLGSLIINNLSTSLIDNVLEALQFKNAGSAGCNITLNKGSMGIAIYPGETAKIPSIRQNYTDNDNDTWLRCGSGVVLTNVYRTGGSFSFASALTILEHRDKADVSYFKGGAVTLATVTLYSGSLVMQPIADGSQITTLILGPDTILDLSKCSFRVTCPNAITMYSGSKIIDPFDRLGINPGTTETITVTFAGCGYEDVEIIRKKGKASVTGL